MYVPLSYKCSNFIAISLKVHDNKSPHVFITGQYWAPGNMENYPIFFCKMRSRLTFVIYHYLDSNLTRESQ